MSISRLQTMVLIAVLIVGGLAQANTVKLKGAEKRKNARTFDRNAIPIDDLVRMEEDLGFAEWKASELRKEAAQEKLAEDYKTTRERYEASLERARLQFIEERELGKKSEKAKEIERIKDFRKHLKEKQARNRRHEEARIAFAQRSIQERDRIDASRLARLQKVYGANRMPAALDADMPKYPNMRQKPPGHPISPH